MRRLIDDLLVTDRIDSTSTTRLRARVDVVAVVKGAARSAVATCSGR
jgi:hypothetical protein